MTRYTLFLLTILFSFLQFGVNAQCDSDAGQYPPDDLFTCDNVIAAPIPSNAFLEPNDGIDYIQFTDPLDPINSVTRNNVARTLAPRNIYVDPHIGDTAIYLAAIVGDTIPDGYVDINDPCLSISNSFKIIISSLECNVEVIETVGCFTTESKLIAKVSGGTPPYEFLWSNGHQGDTLTLFGVGVFGVSITDAENCTTECFGTLSEPVPFEVVVDAFCGGDSIPMFLQGQPPFSGYVIPTSIDPVVLDTIFFDSVLQKMNLLSPDFISFDYNFTDGLGCDTEGTLLIQDPLTCLINQSADSLGCANPTITIEATGNGGNPPYTYSWSNGTNLPILSTNTPGIYTVTVTDNIGCESVCSATVIENTTSDLTCTITPPVVLNCNNVVSCFDAIASGGEPPYTFEWSDGFIGQTICVVNPGTYSVAVIDNTGCETTCTTFVTINNSSDLVCTITPDSQLDCNNTTVCLDAPVTGGTPPYSYNWSNGSSGQTMCVINSGTYSVTIVDANGCATVCVQDVIDESFDVVVDFHCGGDSIPMYFDGQPPFIGYIIPRTVTIVLDTIFFNTNQQLNPLMPDIFSFYYNFTDNTGCNTEGTIDNLPDGKLDCQINLSVDTLTCVDTETEVTLTCSGGTPPYSFLWTDASTTVLTQLPNLTINQPGIYSVQITDDWGCTFNTTFEILYSADKCGYIEGNVLQDVEVDCQLTPTDTPLDCWIVAAYGLDTFYATTTIDGSYILPVAPGTYDVELITPNALFNVCGGIQQVIVADANDTATADFLANTLFNCPLLSIEIGSLRPRRCFTTGMQLEYCNNGTVAATDAYIELVLDPLLNFEAATTPHTIQGDTIVFQIGNVEPSECKKIHVTYSTSCDAVLDQTLCAEAYIYPNDPCPPSSPMWSGASLQITGQCDGDSLRFNIKNVGTSDMTQSRQYIVIEDAAIMRVSNPFTLGAGKERTGAVAATGSTIRIEVEQEDFHPGESKPSLAIERCGIGPFSTGFITQFPLDDASAFVDIACEEVRGSYDPNDKQAEPKGFSTEHFIEPNTDLEYMIRFQNTGNDTAFTVEILDTLSNFLDVTSINPGVSSHDYRFEVFETGILRFTFNDILLVDSFTNEPASNGFVKYSIAQKPDVPLGSVIRNAADIYFDFNDPIYTNQTYHTIGRDFITVKTQEMFVPGAEVNVYPNPFNDKAFFEIKNAGKDAKTLRLLDVSGKIIHTQTVNNERFTLERKNLKSGFYFYEISSVSAKIATGKLVVQ